MKKLILLLFVIITSALFGQKNDLKVIKLDSTLLKGGEFIQYDSYGSLYVVKNNELLKTFGYKSATYKNLALGNITSIDLTNPLTIVLFYENFNTAVVLDDQLIERQIIDFSLQQNLLSVTAVGLASQNQLWVYSSLDHQIGLYNYLKNEYKPVSSPVVKTIQKYHTTLNTFYWIDENNNWYSCDFFGKINFIAKIPPFEMLQIIDDSSFIYYAHKNLNYIHTKSEQQLKIDIPEKTFKKFYYKDQILSIFTAEGITNYKITIP